MTEQNQSDQFPLGKQNFLLIGIGALVVVLGFFLLSGGGAEDPSVYSEDIFSFQRMYIAPLAILAGYGIVMWGIIKK